MTYIKMDAGYCVVKAWIHAFHIWKIIMMVLVGYKISANLETITEKKSILTVYIQGYALGFIRTCTVFLCHQKPESLYQHRRNLKHTHDVVELHKVLKVLYKRVIRAQNIGGVKSSLFANIFEIYVISLYTFNKVYYQSKVHGVLLYILSPEFKMIKMTN